ncbi:MAG: ABC transporter transmembrane domain-containing protein, partial [Candidatus Eisenbacteria bacterium]
MIADELREEGEAKRRIDVGLWRRILRHAAPYRALLAGMALSGLAVAAVDTLLPRVTGSLIDTAIAEGYGPKLLRSLGQYLALIVALAALVWVFIVLAGKIATGFAYDVRRASFARLQQLSLSFFDHRPVGWLLARVTSDCEKVSSILPWFLLDIVWGTALIAGASVSMLLLNARLALFVIALLPLVVAASVFFQRRLLQSQRDVRRVNSEITASFTEAILGVRTTKSLVREEESLREFQLQSDAMYRHSVRNATYAAVYLPTVLSFGAIGTGLALWQGGIQAPFGISLGTLVAFLQYAAFFYAPVEEMAERFTALQAAQASAERIQTLLDTEPEIADSPAVLRAIASHEAARARGETAGTAGTAGMASIAGTAGMASIAGTAGMASIAGTAG